MQFRRASTFVALLSLVTVALAGCASIGGEIDVPAPEWNSGYAWSYTYTTEEDYTYEENGERDNYTDSDQGRFIVQVANTTLKAGAEPVYVLLKEEQDRQRARLQVLSQEDLGAIDYGYSYSTSCINNQCTGDLDLYLEEDEDDIWPAYLDFPLQTGKTWGAVIDLSEIEDEDISISISAVVEGAAIVDLPVGPTTAAKVVIVMQPTSMAELEREIREEGESEGYQVDALSIAMEYRETIYFSQEYQAIVQREEVERERFYARGTDPDGEPFEYRSEGAYTYTEMLDGARLATVPETAADDLIPYLSGDLTLDDPAGQGVIDGGYEIAIKPRGVVINAAEGDRPTFHADLVGVDTLPEGDEIGWNLFDVKGRTIQEGDGEEFQPTVTKPGRYGIGASVTQDGALVTSDGTSLIANWIGTTTLSCPIASTLGVPACDSGNIPAYPGIQSLLVRAVPTGQLGATPGSTMTVYDPFGQPIAGRADGDGYKVEITDFDPYVLDGSDWTMQFRHGAGVASDVDMEIEAIYAQPDFASISVETTVLPDHGRFLERTLPMLW